MAKILIAEDEKDIRDLIAFTLKFAGHEVVLAENGAEALDLARQEPPDMAMLDVRMPKMTGYDVCANLKSDEALSSIPVVFVSAKGQESEIEEGYAVGASRYILKPFTPDQLVECIQELLTPDSDGSENEENDQEELSDERPDDQ